jgi:hypothetical protein
MARHFLDLAGAATLETESGAGAEGVLTAALQASPDGDRSTSGWSSSRSPSCVASSPTDEFPGLPWSRLRDRHDTSHHRRGLRLRPGAGLRRDDRLLRRDARPAFVKRYGSRPGAEYQAGNLTLAIMRTEDFGGTFTPNAMPIALQVHDVAAARERLEAQGVRFVSDTFDSGVCWQAICLDPDGNPLSLHHRYAPKGEGPAAP